MNSKSYFNKSRLRLRLRAFHFLDLSIKNMDQMVFAALAFVKEKVIQYEMYFFMIKVALINNIVIVNLKNKNYYVGMCNRTVTSSRS